MAPIKISTITEKLIFGTSTGNQRKNIESSVGSGSFGSFGEMGSDDAIVIVNPCEYTIEDFERDLEPNDNPYPIKD